MTALLSSYRAVRDRSLELCQPLQAEDFVVQTMPDVSPTKWHLAHVTWFFEQFVLLPFSADYRVFDESFHYLFNSYYYSAGAMHPRPRRGLLSRPTVGRIRDYRAYVDEAVGHLLQNAEVRAEIRDRITLGLNHEQQHQELLLTDIKHVFFCHPEGPAVHPDLGIPPSEAPPPMTFEAQEGGSYHIGADDGRFCFDNETPRHETLLRSHGMGSRPVTNGEFLEFIRGDGYQDHEYWLSDGWATVRERDWRRPLYWSEDLESEFTLGGWRPIDLNAPVTHVSYYEADAYARWAGCRLPSEQEWEHAASDRPVNGNLADSGYWQPTSACAGAGQYFGDVWEWTASAYAPYPGFKPLTGSLGEYNGKFMCNQMTVRGGSCVTAEGHIRPTYRSFFYPDARWQFLGIRLAKDLQGES